MQATDTIAAIATPAGRGGIGVVRVSGPAAPAIAQALCGIEPVPRHAHYAAFRDAEGHALDRGLATWFPAPHSFTGEHVLELYAHGSPVVLDRLLRRVCELGARPARAGEFSERAFLNGKLDLAQAEAVADLIAARSEAQARAAQRSLEGEFSERVQALADLVVRLRVEVEAAIDFAEDASESASHEVLARLFAQATAALDALLAAARRGVRLTDGLHAVIVGAPNVGKSSLMNALAGHDRAIVTDIPGTTRDVLRESIAFDGVELLLADTAGLRESGDTVEGEGIRRARAELERADIVLRVIDDAGQLASGDLFAGAPVSATRILVVNKIDLAGSTPRRDERDGVVTIALSACTGAGLDLLRTELRRIALGGEVEGVFSARARHVLALERAGGHLAAARSGPTLASPELVAEELAAAQRALGEITGAFTSEDLLGAIFSTFCIGK
ncbi:MAG: tRNA-5-carboxymethylaminomethyl-2-thiouridine(34) synthesis protein MnmE [Rhodanobacteraceae bacterium]|jgi:tRNA modification GTPase|nr:MAG: tRNA-5-carboxymethylaminomethyl-2-thiouridine(34) synthesis protein MnmE [Rhodanobacteraceae bacterium]